jgi:eukaryotic-like serine/threonine-protein kinase
MWPFWSPDGRSLAFFTGSKLKKIEVASGAVETLCDAGDARGGTWSRDGVILFSPGYADGLYRVPAAGGPVTPVTTLDRARTDSSHRWPEFLPDGRHFLYVIMSTQADRKGIYLGALDSSRTKRLLPLVSMATWAPPGFLLYARDDTLFAQSFDAKRQELAGEPISIARPVWYKSGIGGFSAFSASQTGLLVYRTGGAARTKLVWFTRDGRMLESTGPAGLYSEPALSPNGQQVAVGRGEDQPGQAQIWVLAHSSASGLRLTFQQSDQAAPLWSPDGTEIVFSTNQTGSYELRRKMANGVAAEEVLLKGDPATAQYADDWSPDGQFIVYDVVGPKGDVDLWLLPMRGDRKPRPFLRTQFRETQARFAPDGRWIAYTSDETGQSETYVQAFPPTGGKWQISDHGGAQPFWRRDGKRLFYLSADRVLMEVDVRPGTSTFQSGTPKPLFPVRTGGLTNARNHYAVSPNGGEFLVNTLEESSETPIAIVVNWAKRVTQDGR